MGLEPKSHRDRIGTAGDVPGLVPQGVAGGSVVHAERSALDAKRAKSGAVPGRIAARWSGVAAILAALALGGCDIKFRNEAMECAEACRSAGREPQSFEWGVWGGIHCACAPGGCACSTTPTPDAEGRR